MNFDSWKLTVDLTIINFINKDSQDIDDFPYWKLWRLGFDPYHIGSYVAAKQIVSHKVNSFHTQLMEGVRTTNVYKKIDNVVRSTSPLPYTTTL